MRIPLWLLKSLALLCIPACIGLGVMNGKINRLHRIISDGKELIAGIDGAIVKTTLNHNIIVHLTDTGLSRVLLKTKVWEPKVTAVLNKVIKPGDVVVELGANFGYHTLHMSQRVGSKGRVYSFEANPSVFEMLTNTLLLNHVNNVTLFNYAAFSEKTELEFNNLTKVDTTPNAFMAEGEMLGNSHVIKGSAPRGKNVIKVPGCRLDDILAHVPRIDVLRMDIEGSEIPALEGAKDLLKRSPHAIIISEWNPSMLAWHGNVEAFLDSFKQRGYSFGLIEPDGDISPIEVADLLKIAHGEIIIAKNAKRLLAQEK